MIRGRGSRGGRGGSRRGRGATRGAGGGGSTRGRARVALAAGVNPKPSVSGAGGRLHGSMQAAVAELGGMSASEQFAAQADAAVGNKDAARAFYPPLKPGRSVSAAGFQQAPHEATFFENLVVLLEPQSNPSRVSDCSVLLSRERAADNKLKKEFWAEGSLAVVPNILPWEVRHDEAARARRKKRRAIQNAADAAILRRVVSGGADGERVGGGEEDDQGDEDDPDKEKDPAAVGAAEKAAEDDENEMDADYQTTARFDDDDGYISQDSGIDAPLF